MPEIVYLNGEYLPIDQAQVSVTDRGFLFADGVYEVISIYQGVPLLSNEHFKRLHRSLREIDLISPLNDNDLMLILNRLIKENPAAPIQSFYIQITRGSESSRHHHYSTCQPTVYARLETIHRKDMTQGVSAITAQDIRWQRCDIKSINRLANVLLAQQAKRAGAEEVIILQNDRVLEGATSNIFIVEDQHIVTPPLSQDILSGITRQTVMTLVEPGMCTERNFTLSELYDADEAWITSSSRGIVPIIQIDDQIVGNGKPGTLYQQVQALYPYVI